MGPFATHRFLIRFVLSAAHIFAWLFIFQYFFVMSGSLVRSLVGVSLAYALTHVISVLATPFFAKRLRRGVRGMLMNALLALAAAFASLAAAFAGAVGSIGLGIAIFAISIGIYRALYWIPYELAARHKSASSWLEMSLAIVPALSGLYIASDSFAPIIVLSLASILALIAIVPLQWVKDTHEGYSWEYRETFRHLFTPAYRIPLFQAILDGFEGAALLLFWPAVALVLLDWSYALIGLVIATTLMLTLIIRAYVTPIRPLQTPVVQSVLTLTGWVLRGTVAAPIWIVLVDTYFASGSGHVRRGADLLTGEQAADSNTYIDEFTALKEMGQGIGRIAFCLSVAMLGAIASFAVLSVGMLALAGLMAVLSIVLSRRAGSRPF